METETKLNEERLKAEEKLRKEETRFDSIPLRFDDRLDENKLFR